MILTDCYRNLSRTNDLIRKGYNPSETTDHFFGQKIILNSPAKIAKYGTVYDLSVGAADFKFRDIAKTYDNYCKLVEASLRGELNNVGQIIYYEKGAARWIHMSNNPNILYSKEAAECLFPKREKYLISLDGGFNYKKWVKPVI